MLPEIVLRRGKSDLNKWPPLWPLWFTNQTHVRFAREAIAFAGVAGYARANHVFPRCHSAPIARHNVIQVKIAPIKEVTAVLAGVLVSLEYVVTREFHFFLWQAIEHEQHDHPRDTNLEGNRGD
jgi:hypothetical protein